LSNLAALKKWLLSCKMGGGGGEFHVPHTVLLTLYREPRSEGLDLGWGRLLKPATHFLTPAVSVLASMLPFSFAVSLLLHPTLPPLYRTSLL